MNPKTGSVSDLFWIALVVVKETVVVVNVPFFSPWLSSSLFGALKFSTPTESIYNNHDPADPNPDSSTVWRKPAAGATYCHIQTKQARAPRLVRRWETSIPGKTPFKTVHTGFNLCVLVGVCLEWHDKRRMSCKGSGPGNT